MENNLILTSIQKGVTYLTYRTLIKSLLAEGKSTGNEQSEELLNYSTLNDKRMDRLDKTLKISEETTNSLNKLNDNFTLLVLVEGWCGDAAQILPVLNKITETTSKIEMKIVYRDENEALMNKFLTNGGKAIPKVLLVNNKNEVLNSWGPRPSIATSMVNDYKKANGGLDADFKKDLQVWYNKNKGKNIQEDIVSLLVNSEVEVN